MSSAYNTRPLRARANRAALRLALLILAAASLAGCGLSPFRTAQATNDRECLARVMYFESNRSSEDGMLAVGTVVMNRLKSGRYPGTICGVVGQPRQFAPGALSLPWGGKSRDRAYMVADRVMRGSRHPGVGGAMFFHTAGLTFPYRNMHYVAVAGGNAFYEKLSPAQMAVAMAQPVQPAPTRLAMMTPVRASSVATLMAPVPAPAPAFVAPEPAPFAPPQPAPMSLSAAPGPAMGAGGGEIDLGDLY